MFVVFVIYAFGHGTTKCNETLQAIPFRPGEGRRVVFDPKFSPQGMFGPLLLDYYSKCLFQERRGVVKSQNRPPIRICHFLC